MEYQGDLGVLMCFLNSAAAIAKNEKLLESNKPLQWRLEKVRVEAQKHFLYNGKKCMC